MSTLVKIKKPGNPATASNGTPARQSGGISIGRATQPVKGVLMAFLCVGFMDGITPGSRFNHYREVQPA